MAAQIIERPVIVAIEQSRLGAKDFPDQAVAQLIGAD
jgi:hypothetical protein